MGIFDGLSALMLWAAKNPKTEVFLNVFGLFLALLDGRGGGARTHDPLIKSQLLFQLSYASIKSVGILLQAAADSSLF